MNTLSVTYKLDINLSMLEAGYRCVPAGVKFKILNVSEVEPYIDSDFFDAMEYDVDSDYDGIGMNEYEWIEYLQNK